MIFDQIVHNTYHSNRQWPNGLKVEYYTMKLNINSSNFIMGVGDFKLFLVLMWSWANKSMTDNDLWLDITEHV